MISPARAALRAVREYVNDTVVRWRSGTREGQLKVLAVLVGLDVAFLLVSLYDYNRMPISGFYVPLLLGTLLLRFWPLVSLVSVTALFGAITVVDQGPLTTARTTSILLMALSIAIILYQSSRQRSGLPGPLGQAMLVDLRDRLQSQSKVPPLPDQWRSQSAMKTASGINFAGDFLVANLSKDERQLEMVLVDVCGKGVSAGSQSLQLAGALGGLIGALPPIGLFAAANDFLLRQHWDEGFATAVHVLVDLETGEYSILNAGHPPAMRWDAVTGEWVIDGARGLALGIAERPEFHQTTGRLDLGDALMFYTDGVVESRTRDLGAGIEWLRETAGTIAGSGLESAPKRILSLVTEGGDDRAVLILDRRA
ncbi:PP2C family protein-serine/threonine phosphatase [Aeromicrobium sp. Leaf350]|uniref:PP2C family protein-serine/threonine phosphatase n=1 Tax=Aeromicrobium sp. Leaf350 TaxID=2876565 RepID=UPI001E52D379|nr:PP2C family protein-serine/threonine phosphatase [Aeromicrobium sp. Leaf350]